VKRASLSAGQSFAKGNQDSQEKAKPGADLVELLAYSGCRIAEANALTWANVDFAKNTLAVTGGAGGTK
jgi:integrase